jgi:transcriptional regulator with XRE-family HTH domain
MKTRLLNGEAITAFRELRGLSGTSLADLIDVDPSTLSRVESGERQLSPEKTKALADVLQVDVFAITYPKGKAA